MVQQELEQSLNQLAEFLVEKIMEHVIDVQVSQKDDSTYYVEMTRDNSDVIEFNLRLKKK